jgi:hypothetical protein
MAIYPPRNHIFTLEHWRSPFSSQEPELNLSTGQKVAAVALAATAAFGAFLGPLWHCDLCCSPRSSGRFSHLGQPDCLRLFQDK